MNHKYLKLKLLLRNYPLRGLYFKLRRSRIEENVPFSNNLGISRLFDVEVIGAEAASFFEKNPNNLDELKLIADEFVSGKITIYNRSIKLSNYRTSDFSKNREKSEIHNKDVRFQWEIYRGKFIYHVCLAYSLTKDKKYKEALRIHLEEWQNYSPLHDRGVMYNGMEAALKIMNYSWIHIFFHREPDYDQSFHPHLLSLICENGNYIFKHYDITIYGLESNHGLSCAIGLVYASLLVPEYEQSSKWRRLGLRCLKRGFKNQFSEAGVNFESSSQYHRYVTELILWLTAALNNVKDTQGSFFTKQCGIVLNALLVMRHSNKQISRLGDSDGGKVLYDLGKPEEFNDLSYLDYFSESQRQFFETIPFSSSSGLEDLLLENIPLPDTHSNLLSFKQNNLSLIVATHSIGTKGKGNHQHNDFGSFEFYGKKPFIVDPWSFCYTGDVDLRNRDRSAINHNAVVIDGKEPVSYSSDALFEMLGDIKVKVHSVEERVDAWKSTVRHDGYKRLAAGQQMVERKFFFDRNKKVLRINDTIFGIGRHKAELGLLIPKKYWSLTDHQGYLVFENDDEIFKIGLSQGKFIIEESEISEGFLSKEKAYFLRFSQSYENEFRLELTISHQEKIES